MDAALRFEQPHGAVRPQGGRVAAHPTLAASILATLRQASISWIIDNGGDAHPPAVLLRGRTGRILLTTHHLQRAVHALEAEGTASGQAIEPVARAFARAWDLFQTGELAVRSIDAALLRSRGGRALLRFRDVALAALVLQQALVEAEAAEIARRRAQKAH